MKPFAKHLHALAARIDGLTPRERAILFCTGLVLVWGLTDVLLLRPVEQRRTALAGQMAELRTRTASAEQAVLALSARPDLAAQDRERLAALERELAARMQATAALGERLIDAKDMPRVLEGLLARQPGLRLAGLQTLAPEPIGRAPDDAAASAAFYRHGVELVMEGSYAGLTRYLEGLERAPLGVLWGRMELDAGDHPRLRLTLVVYTLSENRAWLTI